MIVDLGIGGGALTYEAIKKWKHARFYGVDLDKKQLEIVNKKHPEVSLYNINSLDISLD